MGAALTARTWWPSLQLEVAVRGGSPRLVTKPGILVSTDDLAIRASGVKVVRVPWGPDVPVRFRIDVSGKVASGGFTARRPARPAGEVVAVAAAASPARCPPTGP